MCVVRVFFFFEWWKWKPCWALAFDSLSLRGWRWKGGKLFSHCYLIFYGWNLLLCTITYFGRLFFVYNLKEYILNSSFVSKAKGEFVDGGEFRKMVVNSISLRDGNTKDSRRKWICKVDAKVIKVPLSFRERSLTFFFESSDPMKGVHDKTAYGTKVEPFIIKQGDGSSISNYPGTTLNKKGPPWPMLRHVAIHETLYERKWPCG